MKRPWLIAGLVLLLAGLVALWLQNPKPPTRDAPAIAASGVVPQASGQSTPAIAETSPAPPEPATAPPAIPTPARPSVPDATPEQIHVQLENVQMILRDFRTAFGENPVGSNAEITSALTGNNLKQIRLPIPNGSSVNAEGEMCDRWGTPYFFHQLSGKKMEIHSAGPDRMMGTGDDLVVK